MSESVLFDYIAAENGTRIACITLNAEKSHNALSLAMIREIAPRLEAWRDDATISCILMRGAGEKAFCAGGDVVSLYHAIKAGTSEVCDTFFREEYSLDYAIHTYPKPFLVWGHGIVMGGGLGLMAGASHRIVTERSRIAMPEVTIGLFPDVGGSWFLNRLQGRLGVYLGITGASLNASDAKYVGLADFVLPSTYFTQMVEDLKLVDWQPDGRNHSRLSACIRDASHRHVIQLPMAPVRAHYDAIQSLTDYDDIGEMVSVITSYRGDDEWLASGAKRLAAGSPVSMRLIIEAQRRARHMSLREVFDMEFNLARQCCRHPDFPEGVRALLVDKDHTPRWSVANVSDVTDSVVNRHFLAPD